MKILIVEDHDSLRQLLCGHLQSAGFLVHATNNGTDALHQLRSQAFDAIILDLGLPDMDGLAVLSARQQAAGHNLPCLILSARDSLDSRLAGLDAGADDYILKPFNLKELEARLRAVLRRPGGRLSRSLQYENIEFELDSRHVLVDSQPLLLARRESILLEELMRIAPRIVIKEQAEERLYALGESVTLNAIEAQVSRLRRKLRNARAKCVIDTVHGLGYRLIPELAAN